MNEELKSFLFEVCASPFDDTIRLVLADWLEENDLPDCGSYVRQQVLFPGEKLTIPKRWVSTLDPKNEWLAHVRWKRGFPFLAGMTFDYLLTASPNFASTIPITKIVIHDFMPNIVYRPDGLFQWEETPEWINGHSFGRNPYHVDCLVFNLLQAGTLIETRETGDFNRRTYMTRSESQLDLEHALVRYFRKLANLPELDWDQFK